VVVCPRLATLQGHDDAVHLPQLHYAVLLVKSSRIEIHEHTHSTLLHQSNRYTFLASSKRLSDQEVPRSQAIVRVLAYVDDLVICDAIGVI
jgi:hypothetical protein